MLTVIDFWLLGRLEKFANWWQKLTGKNCFWLAKLSICCFGIVAPITALFDSVSAPSSLILFSLLTAITVAGSLLNIHLTERLVSSLHLQGIANPLKHNRFPRIILILFVVFTGASAALLLWEVDFSLAFIFKTGLKVSYPVSFTVFVYFLSCDPLPPAKSKIKEWKEKLVSVIKGVFAPAPQPSPVPCE